MKKQQIKMTVNGTSYIVEVGDLESSPVNVVVDGRSYSVEINKPNEDETKEHYSAESMRFTPPISTPASQPVKNNPQNDIALNVTDLIVKAPMPGKILDIAVKPGDKVSKGDMLCTLEAMKMKSAIRSQREGVIASVEVGEGQKVLFGDILVRFM